MAKKIESFGVMLDFSRNAVMTLPALKSFLTTIRKMGYNTLFLYMEDTYEVEGEPFFGYMRGRYSVADSSAAKLFSVSLPVDLVPNFVKYRLMLEVFNELDIFKVECLPLVSDENGDRWQLPEDICVITRGGAERVNLEDSEILAKLRLRMTD